MGLLSTGKTREARVNGQKITVKPDETILQAALRQDIDFPYICRVGGCGSCKCKLKSGKVNELTETAYLLTEEEIEDGYILACQSRLKSDVDVEVDLDAAITAEPVFGTIVNKTQLTHDIVRIDVKLDEAIDYRAGQFAELTLAAVPDAPRSYSFSTAPTDDGVVSFTVRRVEGGKFSTHVADGDVIGEKLTIRGPGGSFYMRPGGDAVLMVAGGSGLAPILGMLEEMDRKGDNRPVTLLFGAREMRDLYAIEELEAHAAKWPNFTFVPILSDVLPTSKWTGKRGLVTDFISEYAQDASSAYLCGPPAMIDAAIDKLAALGLSGEAVHADRFIENKQKAPGFYGAVGLPQVVRRPAHALDYLKFFLFHAVGAAAIVALMIGGEWITYTLFALVAFYVIGDGVLGDDTETPEYGEPWILTVQLWMALPMLGLLMFGYLWLLATGDPLGFGAWMNETLSVDMFAAREATTFWHHVSAVIAAGLLVGMMGTITAHELTHRTWDPVSMFIGKWLLAFSFDVGFSIEHVYGHHRYVSTAHDPATAPRGRNVYFHILASTWKGNISAWKIEAERLRRKGHGPLTWRNAYLRGWMLSLALVAIAYAMAGWIGVVLFTVIGLFAKALLEIVNYMEHYGMVRLPDQPVQPRHSWNTNSLVTSWSMFNLSRHSHHHAQGEVPYQDLMPLPDAPVMVGGYLTTIIVTLCPPLWHYLMIPKLKEWDEKYASPEERLLAREANAKSGLRGLRDYDPVSIGMATPAE